MLFVGVAGAAGASTAYVTDFVTNNVTPIDLATNTGGGPIPVGTNPFGIAISPDGTRAYVTNSGSDNVTPIELATNTAEDPIEVGTDPRGIVIAYRAASDAGTPAA